MSENRRRIENQQRTALISTNKSMIEELTESLNNHEERIIELERMIEILDRRTDI